MGERTSREDYEYYYALPLNQVLLLGKTAVAFAEHGHYLNYLQQKGRLLVGKAAISASQDWQIKEETIYELAGLLRGPEPDLQSIADPAEFQSWAINDYLEYGRWIYDVLPPPAQPRHKRINERILIRANYLCLGPSMRQITSPRRFKTTSSFYMQIGAIDSWRRFHTLTPEGALEYVLSVEKELGRMPTEEDLHFLSKQDPTRPSYEVLSARLPEGLSGAAREAGHIAVKHTNGQGQIEWGVEYKVANDNTLPNQESMKLASSVGRAPGQSPARRRFGEIDNFRQKIDDEYDKALSEVKEAFKRQEVPIRLLSRIKSESELITRYVKYGITDQLLPDLKEDWKISLSINQLGEDDFIAALSNHNRQIDRSKVWKAAKKYGVLRNVWRTEYISSLKLDEVVKAILEKSRGELTWRQKVKFVNAVTEGVSFLIENDFKILKDRHIHQLQEEGRIPSGEEYKMLFENNKFYRIMVKTRRHKKEVEALNMRRRERIKGEAQE